LKWRGYWWQAIMENMADTSTNPPDSNALPSAAAHTAQALAALCAAEAVLAAGAPEAKKLRHQVRAAAQTVQAALIALKGESTIDFSWAWSEEDLHDLTAYSASVAEQRGWEPEQVTEPGTGDAAR
jgi:hypothetical protein